MRKMKILYFANHLRGPAKAGGARSWHQVRRLAAAATVKVIIPRFDPLTEEKFSLDPFPESLDVETVLAPSTPPRRSSTVGRLLYAISSMVGQAIVALRCKRPHVVVAMSAPISSALVPLVFAKIHGVPLVVDVRDIPTEVAREIGYVRFWPLLRVLDYLESKLLRAADQIVVVSKEMMPFLVEKGAAKAKLHWLPIGYDDFPEPSEDVVNKEREALRNMFDVPPTTIVLYSGTLGNIMDVETVLRAADVLRERQTIGFVIVGAGQKLVEYKREAAAKQLNVKFLGRVSKRRVHEICRAVDICLYPIRGGSATGAMLGNKIFDYMGAGKCVIYAGPHGAVSTLVTESECGVVCAKNDDVKVAEWVEYFAAYPREREWRGENGRSYVIKNMKAADSAEKLLNLLRKVLEPQAALGTDCD